MAGPRLLTPGAVVPVLAAVLVGAWLAMLFLDATPEKARQMLVDGWPVLGLIALLYIVGSGAAVHLSRRWSGREAWPVALVPLLGVLAWVGYAFHGSQVPVSTLPALGIALLSGVAVGGIILGRGPWGTDLTRLVVPPLLAAGLCAAGLALAAGFLLELTQMVPDLSTGIVLPTATAAERLANSRAAISDPYLGVLAFGGLLMTSAAAMALVTNRVQLGRARPWPSGHHSPA